MPEAIQKLPTIQDAFAEIERQAEERGEKRGEERATLLTQRKTLLQVLRHRFGELPMPIVQQIEATTDIPKLTRWLDEALDAETLAAIDFS